MCCISDRGSARDICHIGCAVTHITSGYWELYHIPKEPGTAASLKGNHIAKLIFGQITGGHEIPNLVAYYRRRNDTWISGRGDIECLEVGPADGKRTEQ